MKSVIVLFCLAVGYSSSLVHKRNLGTVHIVIGDDGTITIDGSTGTRVFISRNLEHSGPKNIEVFLEDTTTPMKRIWMDQETTVDMVDSQFFRGITEADILVRIFKNWQGSLDTMALEALIERVRVCVANGHINMVIYKILTCINVEYVSLERCVLKTNMVNTVRPTLMSILGMRASLQQQQRMMDDELQMRNNMINEGPVDFVIREPRNTIGQEGYTMGQVDPVLTTMVHTVPDERTVSMMHMVQSMPDETIVDRNDYMLPVVQSVPDETLVHRPVSMVPMVQSVPSESMVYQHTPVLRMVQSMPDETIVHRPISMSMV